jgi:hypothetical protein
MNEIHITADGLLAGERYLRSHTEEYNDGTRDGFHVDVIKELVSSVLRASEVAFLMPGEPPNMPPPNSS